jgi:hypothetical protein
MAFISSDIYLTGRNLLVGSLKFQYVEMLTFTGDKITGRQKIATDVGRLRNIMQGPDGYIYLGVEGRILK